MTAAPFSSPARRARRRPHRPSRGLPVGLVLLLAIPLLGVAQGSAPNVIGGVGPVILPAGWAPLLSVSTGTNWTMPSAFWGADVRVYYSLGPAQAAAFNATPISFVRWPGGTVGEQYNYTANRIYADNGTYFVPPSNESAFVAWCQLVACRAILQLPTEIDDPATAAYYVRYTISTLKFHPAYWEIGNEPARWTHFGSPWTAWTTSQAVNTTPGAYALVAQTYVNAIRSVDPHARIIGLAGVGTGSYHEDTWISAVVRTNGPNLSAVAIHVYPAGGSTTSTPPTVGTFLNTLGGHGSLPYRVPKDKTAIAAACPTCSQLGLFVTELGTGNSGGPYSSYMAGFPTLSYIAAEIAQAIQQQIPNVDLYALQSNYSGSLLNSTGAASPIELLYSQLLTHLDPVVLNYTLGITPSFFYVVPARNSSSSSYSLLVVNANASAFVRLTVGGAGFPIQNPGSVLSWNRTSQYPLARSWTMNHAPLWFLLPPRSVLVITVT